MQVNNNQNNKQDISVNNRGFQFFNKNGFEPTTLAVRYWNQHIVLELHPAKEASKQTEYSVFDYDKAVKMIIPPMIAKMIAQECKRKFFPALETGEEYTAGFIVGNDSALTVSTGVKRHGKLAPYISIHRAIQQKTLLPEESLSYYFRPNVFIPNYDGTEASETTPYMHFTEAFYLIDIFERMADASSGVDSHISHYVNRYRENSTFELYRDIASKMGINFYNNSEKRNYGNGNKEINWGAKADYGSSDNSNEVNNIGGQPAKEISLDSLDSFM